MVIRNLGCLWSRDDRHEETVTSVVLKQDKEKVDDGVGLSSHSRKLLEGEL